MTDTGGDPACWADRVCPACGMLDERAAGGRDETCPHCGDRQEDHLAAAPRATGRGAPVAPADTSHDR